MNRSGLFTSCIRLLSAAFLLIIISSDPLCTQAVTQRPRQSSGANTTLQTAQRIYIFARSKLFNREALEREIISRPECREWGMLIVRNPEEADLVLEVTRKKWTTRFTVSLMEPETNHILASGEDSSLGGEIEPKLAARFIRIIKAARSQ